MKRASKKEEDDNSNFTVDEIALLNPSVVRITQKIDRLSPTDRLDVLLFIFATIRRQQGIDETFDPIEFVLGQSAEEQLQIAA